jgi:hypothetical protein
VNLALIGFLLWYYKVQRYQDALLGSESIHKVSEADTYKGSKDNEA